MKPSGFRIFFFGTDRVFERMLLFFFAFDDCPRTSGCKTAGLLPSCMSIKRVRSREIRFVWGAKFHAGIFQRDADPGI